MRTLLLMRHAKAVREPGLSDHARRLNERGRNDAARVARALQDQGLSPDCAIASDAMRTRETLELAGGVFSPKPAMKLDPRLYLASALDMLNIVRATPAAVQRLLLVGHNPGVGELALALAGRGAPEDVKRLAESFPTSAIAVLEFARGWSDVAELDGRLARFILAKPLREAARHPDRDS